MPQPLFRDRGRLPFIELGSIDSTNNYALREIHAGMSQDGTAYFANEQVAGKGQRGKAWITGKNSSILLSVVADPRPLPAMRQFELSACVAVTACEFLRSNGALETVIKWPNDIYWQDRKAGGILIENIIGNHHSADQLQHANAGSLWRWCVIGIGININQVSFPDELKNPVSLRQVTGQEFDPVGLARDLHHSIYNSFQQLKTHGFQEVYNQYNSLLYKKGEKIKFRKDSRVFEAVVRSVSADGRLVLDHGIEEPFNFGEIEWLIPTPLKEK